MTVGCSCLCHIIHELSQTLQLDPKMKNFIYPLVLFAFVTGPHFTYGQTAHVNWSHTLEQKSESEIMLKLNAKMAPGWFLYSQHIQDGGPVPTQVSFNPSQEYVCVGPVEEKGKQIRYYDEIYDLEIIRYAETVMFQQKFRLDQPVTTLIGKIEYMICNNEVCVPDQIEFSIAVNLIKKN
jgi:DsbC/DsbD-like thiol-disulfide interchange protein